MTHHNYTVEPRIFGMAMATNIRTLNTLIEAMRIQVKMSHSKELLQRNTEDLMELEILKQQSLIQLN